MGVIIWSLFSFESVYVNWNMSVTLAVSVDIQVFVAGFPNPNPNPKSYLGSLWSQRCFPQWKSGICWKLIIRNEWMDTDNCKGRVEAATVSDIFYLFSQENFIFTRELKIRDIWKVMSVATMSLKEKLLCSSRI